MTFAEHAVAQVLRELAAEFFTRGYSEQAISRREFTEFLYSFAQRLSPKPPGEK